MTIVTVAVQRTELDVQRLEGGLVVVATHHRLEIPVVDLPADARPAGIEFPLPDAAGDVPHPVVDRLGPGAMPLGAEQLAFQQ